MLGSTARPSVPGWGPRACISLHRVRRSLSHNLAPVLPPSSSPSTSASDQTSRRLASLCSRNVPSSFQRRGFCSSCAWKSLLPRGNCCISSRAAPPVRSPLTPPPPAVSQGCCSEDSRPCREQETSAPPQFWELEVPAKAPAGLCPLCRLCRRTCSPPFSGLLLGTLGLRLHRCCLPARPPGVPWVSPHGRLVLTVSSSLPVRTGSWLIL